MSKQYSIPLTIIFVVLAYTFWGLQNIFFQQDEWLGLGNAITRRETSGFFSLLYDSFFKTGQIARILPMTAMTNYLVFNTFKTTAMLYGFLSFVIALTNTFLFYLIIKKLFKDSFMAIAVSLFWVTNVNASQSITWIATIIPSQLSVLFFLISWYLWISWLVNKSKYFLWFSIAALIASLFYKETGAFYLVPFVLTPWILKDVKIKWLKMWPVLLPVVITLLIPRLLLFGQAGQSQAVAIDPPRQEVIVLNTFIVPIKSLSQVFIPSKALYDWTYKLNAYRYDGQTNGYVVESIIADITSLLLASGIFLVVILSLYVLPTANRKLVLFALLSFFAATELFIFFPNKAAIVEPRYFIFPALWSSLLLGSILFGIASRIPLGKLLIWIIIIPILLFNITFIKKDLNSNIYIGSFRAQILKTIKQQSQDLKNNTIFYFFTDNNGFYEFQSGTGQMLAVWLHDTGKVPTEAMTDLDFWNPYYEGVKSYPQGKYGYFMSYEKLSEALKQNPDIDLDGVHAYYWDLQKHTVTNVSPQIHDKLKEELQ